MWFYDHFEKILEMVMKKGVCQCLTHSRKYCYRDAPKTVQIYIYPYENKGKLQALITSSVKYSNQITLSVELE